MICRILSPVDRHVFLKICFCFHGNIFRFFYFFLYVKIIINFKRVVNPSLVPRPQAAPSSRDDKESKTHCNHITYRLHDHGRKLTIVIQVVANLTLVHPSVVSDAHLVFRPNFIRLQYLHYVVALPHPINLRLIYTIRTC
jgi:hypothetical protein